ncbi:MAG TPA: FKBP-type peptidyl-prolyl cis-trans isomerase [Burkholderiaceae bacterium]|nr:FKBP-type peptidyl-prolyl cis-trans isomerase [Burkholderiaceae bacterium]
MDGSTVTPAAGNDDGDALPRIAATSFVTLHYRLVARADGAEREVFSSFGAQPVTVQLGAGSLASALESRLVGLPEGAQASFDLGPHDAFGTRNPELVQVLSASFFAENADPGAEYAPGDVVSISSPDGRRVVGVLKQRDERRVVVDFNHPLAGLPLHFSVHVIGVL